MLRRSIAAVTVSTFLLSACQSTVGSVVAGSAILVPYVIGLHMAANDPCTGSLPEPDKIHLMQAKSRDFFELRQADLRTYSVERAFGCLDIYASDESHVKVLVQSKDFISVEKDEDLSRRRTNALIQYLREEYGAPASVLSVTQLKDRRLQEIASRLLRENSDIVLFYFDVRCCRSRS